MKTQTKCVLSRLLSLCITFSLLFSLLNLSGITAYAAENDYEKTTLLLNSDTLMDSTIDAYLLDSTYYIKIDDLCSLARCSQEINGDVISISQGFWRATFDIKKQQFDDGYQTVDIKLLEVDKNQYAIPALMFLCYFKAAAFIDGETLYCRMPETTAWEALNVDFGNSLVDIYELYGGEGNVTLSLTLDILMDFIMGNMSTSDDYLSDAFLAALQVDMYDYSSVENFKEESQNRLYMDIHSDRGVEFVEAVDTVLSLSAEPTEWYIQYYYNAIEKSFVSHAYDAFEAGQHADVTHYGKKFYEAFTEKNRVSDTADDYFDNADYLMLFISAAVETAQEMKYVNATNNLVYNVMGKENLNYLGISADDNDWFTVADRYKNVLGVAATQLEAEAMQYLTDTLCWETLIGTGVSSAAGISGGAWTFSLNFARFFVENFPLTSSSIEAFEADRRALYLSELQQNVYWVAMNTLQDMEGKWGNPEIYTKYIQALQLYCRTSIAMYENLITMVDEFGNDREYWTNLFQTRIDMLALSLYRLTTLQDDGVNGCLPLELSSFVAKENTDTLDSNEYGDILDMYYESISCNWTNCDGDGWDVVGDPDNVCYIFYHYEKNRSLSEIGYSLLDINGDGQKELFISLFDIADSGSFYDMYSIVGGEVVHVVSAGERDRYNLAEDYSINNHGSSSAISSTTDNLRLDGMTGTLSVNQAVIYDGWKDRDNPYFYATTDYYNKETYEINYDLLKPISDEKASDLLDSFPDNLPLELNPFSEYMSHENQGAQDLPAISSTRAYKEILQQYSEMAEYTLYDIDKNGVCELIVYDGWEYIVYTMDGSNPILCGKCYAYYRGLYAFDGEGLIVHEGGTGYLHLEYVNLYVLSSNRFENSKNVINTEESSMDDLYKCLEKYTKLEDFHPVSDYSLLENG